MKKIYLLLLVLLSLFEPLKVTAQQPFIGEIKMFAGNYAPQGWRFCNGDAMPIANNEALFFLIGTTYGGDGQNTFNLPDLRGRAPLHVGATIGPGLSQHFLGEQGGSESVALTVANLPTHSHILSASSSAGTSSSPQFAFFAESGATDKEYSANANTTMGATSLTGNNVPIENMKPYLTVNFIIAVEGIFPTQN